MEDHEDNKVSMDVVVPPTEHLCYVRCNFCDTLLTVGIPCKRMLETVTVKCGHCSNLTFLATRPPLQGGLCLLDHPLFSHQVKQGFCGEFRKGGQTSSSSSSSVDVHPSPKEQFVVKPPEKKHRLPSAYNRFMKEEIQRIKSGNPEIPHREAFSTAAKNVVGKARPKLIIHRGLMFLAMLVTELEGVKKEEMDFPFSALFGLVGSRISKK